MSRSLPLFYYISDIMSVLYYDNGVQKVDAENFEILDFPMEESEPIIDGQKLLDQGLEYQPVFVKTIEGWIIFEGRPYTMLPNCNTPLIKERILAYSSPNFDESSFIDVKTFKIPQTLQPADEIPQVGLALVDYSLFTKLVRILQNELSYGERNSLPPELIRQTISLATLYSLPTKEIIYQTKYGLVTGDGYPVPDTQQVDYITDLVPVYRYIQKRTTSVKPILIKTTNSWLIVDGNKPLLDVILIDNKETNIYTGKLEYYQPLTLPGLQLADPSNLKTLQDVIQSGVTLADLLCKFTAL